MKRKAGFFVLIPLIAAVFCLVLLLPKSTHAAGDVEINSTNFPDKEFRSYVKKYCDKNNDGYLSEAERLKISDIDVYGYGITSLKGIEFFPNLIELDCDKNMLKELDVTNNTKLKTLYAKKNQLVKLYVNNNPELVYLDVEDNQLPGIDLSNNHKLEALYIRNNPGKKYNIKETLLPQKMAMWNYCWEDYSYIGYNYINFLQPLDDEEYTDSYLSCDTDDMLIALDTPDVSAVNKGDGIRLSWSSVQGASEYEVWRAPKGSSNFELKASDSVNTYTDNTAEPGNAYSYKVCAKNGVLYSKNTAVTMIRNPFTDVSESNSYYDAVMWAVKNGITSGTSATTFSPNADCTRYQFAVMLYKYAGKPAVSGTLPFKDVSKKASYYKAVLWAYTNGIISGTSKTTFSPYTGITRYQVVAMLYKFAGKPAMSGTLKFVDVSENASYYKAVLWAVKKGITKGTDSTHFSPNAVCKRYQMVVFLYKFNNIYHIK